jgi:DNA-binding NarL/FixJ family response regulator
MTAAVRVLIVDDHDLVRITLAERLRREVDIAVVGAVGAASAAADQMGRMQPDVVLLETELCGASALGLAAGARGLAPHARIILVSRLVYDRYIDAALELSVPGYVSKSEPVRVLIEAIRTVAAGGAYFSAKIRQRMVPTRCGARWSSRCSALTPRQRDVLAHIARGYTKSAVAELLGVSSKSIDTHCEALMRRLLLRNRVELARFAIRERLIEA